MPNERARKGRANPTGRGIVHSHIGAFIGSVRRLAWALKKSMPKTVDLMVGLMPSLVEPSKACLACQDQTKCHACIFSRKFTRQEQAALAVL